jgi:hypothetical protein
MADELSCMNLFLFLTLGTWTIKAGPKKKNKVRGNEKNGGVQRRCGTARF